MEDGKERPIAYASQTLSVTERKYPQFDIEALAIVWAAQKFFLYLYARHFTLITDHKPLPQILHPDKGLPTDTKTNINADFCSRAIDTNMIGKIREEYDEFDNFVIRQMQQLPTTPERIASETRKDDELGKIVRLLEAGKCLKSHGYKSPVVNYKLFGDCLVFEHRVVIPPKLQHNVLKDLHAAHQGVVKMKDVARYFVYWPGLDKHIEDVAKACDECGRFANVPVKFGGHHWQYPKQPWERINIDWWSFCGKNVITSAYSKWIEVKITPSTSSAATINALDELFSSFGDTITVVSDNGMGFSSAEFKDYLTRIGV
ncbi:uncharacterized protein K02A2.6-like [Stomoxys calcitrans]|uniref:uncharacterized protein K02A2.6-like n=1 Tax=Stomoxys calcitrans TaxID=35570 RepID=UPI0027E28E4D|nr:uncharacterized protein K02A2.6-like [Stomoxys calcitrans]